MHPLAPLALLLPAAFAAPTPSSRRSMAAIPNEYIITLKPGVSPSSIHRRFTISSASTTIDKVYEMPGFAGFSGNFDAATIAELEADESIASIEPVLPVYTQDEITVAAPSVQDGAPWGLGSISHRTPNHTDYLYDSDAGEGTYAYVIDTGLYMEHEAFADGKGTLGYNAYPGTEFEDLVGHGTHCAGTIASEKWGVAKKAHIVSVKVFDRSGSTTAIVLDGYQWAVNDIVEKGRTTNAVISMSLGGGKSQTFNDAVAAAYEAGVTTVVAAGNSYSDAANYSPASEPSAITVGAVDITNTKPGFSNYGSLLDVFAPGVDVESAWIGATDATNIISGTSMATPHVSGLVLYLMSVEGLKTPAEIAARITELATTDVVVSEGDGSPNLLAFNGINM